VIHIRTWTGIVIARCHDGSVRAQHRRSVDEDDARAGTRARRPHDGCVATWPAATLAVHFGSRNAVWQQRLAAILSLAISTLRAETIIELYETEVIRELQPWRSIEHSIGSASPVIGVGSSGLATCRLAEKET
jgi:hypothetical protein